MAALRQLKKPGDLAKFRQSLKATQDPERLRVRLCTSACRSAGAGEVLQAFRRELDECGLTGKVELIETGCHGLCANGPVAIIDPAGILYQGLDAESVREIVRRTLKKGEIVLEKTYFDSRIREHIPMAADIPFFADQVRVILRNFGRIDPHSINDYIMQGGYDAFVKALSMEPDEIVEAVVDSGLRGRGGAGFPTGLKWRFTRDAGGTQKYVICNGEEGEPGTFVDKVIMESDPHSVIEGMMIAGYAIGASVGYLYLQSEYHKAIEYLETAIKSANGMGLLGKDILGSGFDFELRLHRAPGSFVCGEETALMNTIEGKRGNPRLRPPHPPQSGLWGRPTAINNVETLANIPPIILNGAEWYGTMGTENSRGTKVHSLSGILRNTGLIELPMGYPLKDFIFKYGGGIESGHRFKAIHVGGPSGAMLSPKHLDLPVDYDALGRVGAFMGAGAIVPLSDKSCLVDYAKSLFYFFQDESCGKCVPCRLGTRRIYEILVRITSGLGEMSDLDKLEELALGLKDASFCGLGQMAPTPLLSLLEHFREEFREHIEDKHCAACVCDDMVVAPCQHACPAGVDVPAFNGLIAEGKLEEALSIYKERNPLLGVCAHICPHPCQTRCTREELDETIGIFDLERFVYENIPDQSVSPAHRSRKTDKWVAIIGSGPSGLTAAYQLALAGHNVTVFEGGTRPGGLLNAMPNYKMPREVLERDISAIEKVGVEIKTKMQLGRDIEIDRLLEEGYSAVLISIGTAQREYRLIDFDCLSAAEDGVRFLFDARAGRRTTVPKRVAVVGPVALASDVARTALRLGAKKVHLIAKESPEDIYEMPDLRETAAEGVQLHMLASPLSVETDEHGATRGLRITALDQREWYEGGKRALYPVEGSENELPVDAVFSLFRKPPDMRFLEESGIAFDENGAISIDVVSHMTTRPGVFAIGSEADASVIRAIAAGQKAAFAVERHLTGFSTRERELQLLEQRMINPPDDLESRIRVEEIARHHTRYRSARSRSLDFEVYRPCLSCSNGTAEAGRCLRCDLESVAGRRRMAGEGPAEA